MKKSIIRTTAAILMSSVFILGNTAPLQVNAYSGEQVLKEKVTYENRGKSWKSVKENKISDQPTIEKKFLDEFRKIDQATGRVEFWRNMNPEELEKYYINDDLSIDFKDSTNQRPIDIQKKENFEQNFKQYVSNIKDYCEKEGQVFDTDITDGEGGLGVGGITGDGNGTNSLSVSSCVKGDVLLLNNDEVHIYGAILHGGIYDGSSTDLCIYSASKNGSPTGVRWERVSDWRKNDQAWTLYVKGTSNKQRANAFDYVHNVAGYGESYDWNASKSSTDSWYCSKIPWYAYKNSGTNIDIDSDGGLWCYPIDIYNSNNTVLINYFS